MGSRGFGEIKMMKDGNKPQADFANNKKTTVLLVHNAWGLQGPPKWNQDLRRLSARWFFRLLPLSIAWTGENTSPRSGYSHSVPTAFFSKGWSANTYLQYFGGKYCGNRYGENHRIYYKKSSECISPRKKGTHPESDECPWACIKFGLICKAFYLCYASFCFLPHTAPYFDPLRNKTTPTVWSIIFTSCISEPFVALAIKVDSRGPVFFSQVRIGKNGRRFKMYKFRSMYIEKSPFHCLPSAGSA